MANKLIEIELDRKRFLETSINVIIKMEEELGRPLNELQENIKISDIRTILYCLLFSDDKKLTKEKVGELMDVAIEKHGIQYLSDKLTEALMLIAGHTNTVLSKSEIKKR